MNADDREKTCLPLLETAAGFAGIPVEALRFIAGGCHTRTATRDQVLCEKGQQIDGFFVVVSGRIKLSILSEDGAERVLDVVLPGRTFAEAAAFLDQPCPLHAQALTDSRLLFVSLPRVREAMGRWPQVANLMLAIVARRTQRLTADLEACCLHSAAQRVAGFLLREAVSDADDPDHASVTLPAAKTVIASSLNLSAETFSRELHGLARRGLVDVQRREIRIPSLRRLRGPAGADAIRTMQPSTVPDAEPRV
jgi:CRP-like cAMP-binding protein